jgi:DNA polymerase-3 subunit delta
VASPARRRRSAATAGGHATARHHHPDYLARLEKTQLQSKWFLALEKAAVVVEAKPVGRHELAGWIARRLKRQQHLSRRRSAFLPTGWKAICWRHGRKWTSWLCYPAGELTLEQLREAVANVARFDVFHLSEAWLSGDTARVERMLEGLLAEGESPVLVLWSFTEDVRMLLRLRQGLKDGRQLRDLARELRLWGDKQRLAEPACVASARKLMTALTECARIDQQIKGVARATPGMPCVVWPCC